MRTIATSITLFFIFFIPDLQAQDLPQPSPKAEVEQRVGLTDVEIEYSSPGVKGREIFGGLVSYDKLWRTGANAATTIEFSKDVMLEGNEVPAGKYSLFTIPAKDRWTVVLNKKTELWGTGNYKKKHDICRFKIEPEDLPRKRERMTFLISDFDDKSASIELEWAKTGVSFSMETKTDEQAMANIEKAFSEIPGKYANSARYTLRAKKHYDKGLEWANTSIELDQGWYNTWIKAEILMRKGNFEKAHKHMKKAKELGENAENFFYEDKVKKQLKKLEEKVGG